MNFIKKVLDICMPKYKSSFVLLLLIIIIIIYTKFAWYDSILM